MDIIEKAKHFATYHHGAINQKRKYTGEDYIVHPKAVAEIVASVTDDKEMIAAAWLHDTVEDTSATSDDIKREFGDSIAKLVEELTDVSTLADGNRHQRKMLDREHLAQASARGQTIKLADLINNSSTIMMLDPSFARVYIEEKQLLLQVLTKGDQTLWNQANQIVDNYNNRKKPSL